MKLCAHKIYLKEWFTQQTQIHLFVKLQKQLSFWINQTTDLHFITDMSPYNVNIQNGKFGKLQT